MWCGRALSAAGVKTGSHWHLSAEGSPAASSAMPLSNGVGVGGTPAFWSTDGQPNPGLVLVSVSSRTLPWWPRALGTSFGKPLLLHSGPEWHQGLYLPGFSVSWSAELGTKSPDTFTGQTVHRPNNAARSGARPAPTLSGCFAGSSLSSGRCQPTGYGSAESRLPVCDCWLVAAVAEVIRDIKKCELPLGPEDTIRAVPRNTLQRDV